MPPKHFRWTVVQSVPRGTPDKLQQFRFYLHVCDSRHFRSINNFDFFDFCGKKWSPAAILDDRKLLLFISRHFRSIRNLYFFEYLHKMAAGGHFGRPKITFDRISRHFKSIRNLFVVEFFAILFKMATSGHFGCPNNDQILLPMGWTSDSEQFLD